MSWDMTATVEAVASLVQTAPAAVRVYSAAAEGVAALPAAVNEFPAVLVYPEDSAPVSVSYAGQLRTTTVMIDVLAGRWDIGLNARAGLVVIEDIISRLHTGVVLTPGARWVSYTVQWTVPLEWGGIVYAGGRISVEVVEDQQEVLQP